MSVGHAEIERGLVVVERKWVGGGENVEGEEVVGGMRWVVVGRGSRWGWEWRLGSRYNYVTVPEKRGSFTQNVMVVLQVVLETLSGLKVFDPKRKDAKLV